MPNDYKLPGHTAINIATEDVGSRHFTLVKPADGLEISRGSVANLSSVNRFGAIQAVGTTYEDVWSQGGTWVPLAAATTLAVSSSNAADTAAGTGARTLRIQGLDANYLAISEDITLAGLTPVITTELFLFVNRAFVLTGGSASHNVGVIYIVDDSDTHTAGVPDTPALLQAYIIAAEGETRLARYTIPDSVGAYLTSLYTIAGENKIITFQFWRWDHINRSQRIMFEGLTTDSNITKVFHPPAVLDAKTTILVRTKVSVGTAAVASGFDIILESA